MILLMRHVVQHDETSSISGIFLRSKELAWGFVLIPKLANLGWVQSTHFGRRTPSYVGRIGPDSLCFRVSPVFAEEGMQFESHLGHVFSLFRGL
ncbi:hypothetical protein C8D78_3382 [Arthrobacter oryzae]|uniref:Uncharacterized protein n=1 Tax=Arthrobacter oryzae TaxID=409290 RepID=A0A495E9Y0_9MICC|nr:hypothetical protein C8D78_3382 [Arthrobacter oryzae]